MNDYKVNFKDMKSRVGIDDVAYALGYRLDRKAGVGRYIELVLGEGRDKRDTLIVSHPHDKAHQTFFRRDGTKGDVVTLIRENLGAFFTTGKEEWQRVAQVMARFANMPEPEYKDSRDLDRRFVNEAKQSSKVFDSTRYDIKPIELQHVPALFGQRGISAETVKAFAPFISLIRDKQNGRFDGYNVGFPYMDGNSDTVQGYEIRGYGGYKSKAAGTNSCTAAWVAIPNSLPIGEGCGKACAVRSVCFFESALDAMSFYQLNRAKLHGDIALVSLGGTFSDGQVKSMMQRFPDARPFDCFDNDLAGRVYGLRLMAIAEDIPMKIIKADDNLQVEVRGKSFSMDKDRPMAAQMEKHLALRHKSGQWLPPKDFKDWNDVLLNKPMTVQLSPHKEERDQNLAERRGGIRM